MKPERLVVIDDNPNDAQIIRRVLEKAGYEVRYAHSGEAGLTLLASYPPDCVLVDYRMPGMDGYEVSRRLKADPALQNVPVLMLTGADSAQNLVQGLDAGADDFVTKSADIEVILARVRAALRVKAYQDRIVEQAAELQRLNDRLNSDLHFARRVQEALLPQREFATARAEIRSAYIPSETLSGDFYDYFQQRNALYLFVADVSGHGLPAAILVSLLKSFLHSEAADAESLGSFMASLNDFLSGASLPTQFATAQLLRLDEESMSLAYANAAHPPFLLLRRGERKASAFETPGHLLGALPGMVFEEHQLDLAPGDLLFAYTDGLTDRRTRSGDFYAIDRVAAILESSHDEDLSTIYSRVYDDVSGFEATDEYRDDIAFVLTRFR
jgi:serine phosphatase RsbU (regulator of sigma subunit)